MSRRGPTVISMPTRSAGHGSGGISCCCCRCCTCIHLEFLRSQHGLTKLAEAILGGLCQSLLIKYGLSQAGLIGQAFNGFLTTASSCLLTTSILLACYVVSSNTYNLLRQSLFETVFNAVACFLYLSASSYLGFAVNMYLYPAYMSQLGYAAYPAMTAVYYIGCIVGIIHGVDAFYAFRHLKGYR